ncbi:AraC family transcriptional regulator [Bifidobacterium goeldii]|uniref:AraC family transcriptional regulator n=1 Tax=Bifidobacterium goeldii TaxID=2306975 RepID=A0A430FNI7_9BIFI|nr:AraC family transcriptional regulator [Bifidobacterium goeldii]RSX54400.1 AraC family transcriptional regulator [Bifidobacterium goeldii]
MKMLAAGIDPSQSNYWLASPAAIIKQTFLYPITAGALTYYANYSLRRRSIDNFMIAYIRQGTLHVKTAGVTHTASQGQFIVLDCSIPHDFWTTEPCQDYFMHFNGPSASAYCRYIVANAGNVITPSAGEEAVDMLRRIIDVLSGRVHASAPELNHSIDGILTVLASERTDEPRTFAQTAIDRVVSYITEHLAGDLSIDALAVIACMSRFHFAKTFKELTGDSPYDFVTRTRVEHAKYLLSLTDMPVAAVGRACGYSAPSTFCAMFRRETGASPSTYRSMVMPISDVSEDAKN